MASGRTQSKRFFGIKTAAGADALLAWKLSIRESMSRPFQIEADLLSEDPAIALDKVVGEPATVRLELGNGSQRFFNGVVARLEQGGPWGDMHRYRATIVPWLWLLTRTADCRIFQKKDPVKIIEEIFSDNGFSSQHFGKALTGKYEEREFVVQYRETAFNFVSRWLEHEGIGYFFEHKDGQHKLILCDHAGAHDPYPGFDKIPLIAENPDRTDLAGVTECWAGRSVHPTKVTLEDYDFTAPGKELKNDSKISRQHGYSSFEVFDYPGDYVKPGVGAAYAKVRLEEIQSEFEVVRGVCTARGLAVGSVVEFDGATRGGMRGKKWLVTSADYRIEGDDYGAFGRKQGNDAFVCSFTAMDAKTPHRPARLTARPTIAGPQTAKVVGGSGEEITTDEWGRVKVQFHWDHRAKGDESSSCWIRVSSSVAGKNWGQIFLPRHGQEVIVEFLEGDPDKPIITGRVYNGDNKVPYALPANKTISTLKSDSSKGSGGFNEVKFEDKKGSELLYVQAQKDRTVLVKNDNTETVQANEKILVNKDRTKTIDGNETTTVHKNRTETVDLDETITVNGNRTETVNKNETISITMSRTETVGQAESVTIGQTRTHTIAINDAQTVGAAQEVTVGAAQAISVGAAQTISVGAAQTMQVGGSQTITVGGSQTTGVGGNRETTVSKTDTLKVTKKIIIDGGDEILIKSGDASILLKKDGTIQIKGKDIKLVGSGKISAKADGDVVMKGSKILQN